MSLYNVPADWKEISHTSTSRGDFIGDPTVHHSWPIGWLTPEGNFISPDKLPDQYRVKPDNRMLDADSSGKLMPEITPQSNPSQIIGLTPEGIREKLAAFMGWEKKEATMPVNRTGYDRPEYYYDAPQGAMWVNLNLPASQHWKPDQDRNQLALVLGKLGQDFTQWTNFIIELDHMVMPDKYVSKRLGQKRPPEHYISFQSETLRDLMLAPPETICKAILKVIEKESN